MPVVTIQGIPNLKAIEGGETLFFALLKNAQVMIQQEVASIPELGITPDDVTVLAPVSLLCSTQGEIIVSVDKLYEKPERTKPVLDLVASKIMNVLKGPIQDFIPGCRKIEVFVSTFDPQKGGLCSANL